MNSARRVAVLAPPLDLVTDRDPFGRPRTRRAYSKEEFVGMWQVVTGYPVTTAQRAALDRGCVGVTMLRLGLTEDMPPTNLAFADSRARSTIAGAETVLAPGEVATRKVRYRRAYLAAAHAQLAAVRARYGGNDDCAAVHAEYKRVQDTQYALARARAEARDIWTGIPKADKHTARSARTAAKIDNGHRSFERVSAYAAKFTAILARGPRDTAEFLRAVAADPALALLREVDRHLPSGSPQRWQTVIYAKHFWSGQERLRDHNGEFVYTSTGLRRTHATATPCPTRFVPDPTTGQVDMSGDFLHGKPGHTNFDYGFYDPGSASWWHANHHELGDKDLPMRIYQSAPQRFFAGRTDFDCSVICIGFSHRPQSPL